MVKKFSLIFLTLLMMTPVQAKSEAKISQVVDHLPYIQVYVDGGEKSFQKKQAFLGERKLTFKRQVRLDHSRQGTNYYILCDNSISVSSSYLKAMKRSLLKFSGKLRKPDTMQVYTFGTKLRKITDSHASEKNQLKSIAGMQADEHGTKLFQAVEQISDRAEKNPQNNAHSVIMLLSDGVDFTTGNTTKREALNALKQRNIPVYGIAFASAQTNAKNSFGAFVRESGGRFLIQNEKQLPHSLLTMAEFNNHQMVVTYDYGSNQITNKTEQLTITNTSDRDRLSKKVFLIHYMKDTQSPYITHMSAKGKTLTVYFSEAVVNASDQENYHVEVDGHLLNVTGVTSRSAKHEVDLHFDKNLVNGTYKVKTKNIYDRSLERNKLKKSYKQIFTNLRDHRTYGYWVIAAILIIILVIIFLLKKRKKAVVEPVIDEEPITLPKREPEVTHHQVNVMDERKKIEVDVVQDGIFLQTLEIAIDRSCIFGRSSICDCYFDETAMSRQHFALEIDGQDLFVEDLQSRNGTKVNGITIKNKTMLKSGDVITAGSMDFRVRW